jgi:hypothetical protein
VSNPAPEVVRGAIRQSVLNVKLTVEAEVSSEARYKGVHVRRLRLETVQHIEANPYQVAPDGGDVDAKMRPHLLATSTLAVK